MHYKRAIWIIECPTVHVAMQVQLNWTWRLVVHWSLANRHFLFVRISSQQRSVLSPLSSVHWSLANRHFLFVRISSQQRSVLSPLSSVHWSLANRHFLLVSISSQQRSVLSPLSSVHWSLANRHFSFVRISSQQRSVLSPLSSCCCSSVHCPQAPWRALHWSKHLNQLPSRHIPRLGTRLKFLNLCN